MTIKTERKPLDFYLGLKYPITIIPDETGGYVAEIEDLSGCFTQGETLEEVFANMEESRRLWLEIAYEDGIDIPLPRTGEEYIVRLPQGLYRKLDQAAKREGVSLNQYLVSALSHAVGMVEAPNAALRQPCVPQKRCYIKPSPKK